MIVYADNIWEPASNKPASGSAFNMSGTARDGFRKVSNGIANTNSSVFKAFKVDGNGNPTGAWEIFIGTVTTGSPDTVSRDYLIRSSTGSFIDWSASGENVSPDLICPMPAAQAYNVPTIFGTYLTPIDCDSNIGTSYSSQQVEVSIIGITRPCKLDKLRCEITTAQSGSSFHLGIYGDMEGTPTLLHSAINIASTSNGIKETSSFSNAYLMPGIYGLAFHGSNNAVQTRGISSGATTAMLGFADGCSDSSLTGTKGFRKYSHSFSSGGLPSSLNGSLTYAVNNAALVQIKLASP